jgi:hypothetical protein
MKQEWPRKFLKVNQKIEERVIAQTGMAGRYRE